MSHISCLTVGLLLGVGTSTLVAQSPNGLPAPLAKWCHAVVSPPPAATCTLLRELLTTDSTTTAKREWANQRLERAKRLAGQAPDEAMAWYTLAIADLVASRAGVIAGSGPLQVSGVTHEAAAGRALIRALELDSGFVAAAEALALVPRPREGPSELVRAMPVLRPYRARLHAAAQLAVARKEREAGSLEEALAWLNAIDTSASVPAGVVALERTRVLYLLGRPDQASASYYAGAADTAGMTQRAYRAELAMVAEPEELGAWDAASVGQHADWLRVFWNKRDVVEGWPVGTRLQEHYRRVEAAWQRFRLTIPTTGRHQAFSVARSFDFFAEELLQKMYIQEGGENGRLAIQKDVIGNGGLLRAFTGSIEGLDDRGLVYIRQGEPDKTARTVGGESLVLWLYDRPENPLLLSFREMDFDGQIGASVLTPTTMGADPLQRQQLCHLDVRLCPIGADPRSQFLTMGGGAGVGSRQPTELQRLGSGVLLEEARREGLAAITAATTTDANDRKFERPLDTRAVFHGLHAVGHAEPVLVVPFAIPGDRLTGEPIDPNGTRVGYRLHFVVEAVRDADGLNRRLDTLRAFAASHTLAKGEYLSGVLELPLPPGRYTVSLMTTDDRGAGEVVSFSRVQAPDIHRPSLSDLVLGTTASGVRWETGGAAVALNPLNTFRREGDAELFVQLFDVPAETLLPIRVEVWSADTTAREPRLTIAFQGRSTGLVTPLTQTLGLAKLEPGRYRLRVSVNASGRNLMSEAWLTVVR